MDQSEQHTGRQGEPPIYRRRGWITSGALVGTGLLAGAILAGTLSANAAGGGGSSVSAVPAAATSTETAPDHPDSDGPGFDWWGGRHGHDEAQVPDDTATKVKDAVLAQYPGASIWWVRSNDGGYDAYIDTADGKDLDVHLDGSFAITGTDDLPNADGQDGDGHGWMGHGWDGACADDSGASVPDDAAAKVKDAVLAQYPDASIWWVRSDNGGYDAYIDTADGKDLAVHLDGSFAITGTDDLSHADGHDQGGTAVSDETAGHVKDAVLAKYPGATVPWIWTDTADGGYVALALTTDDNRVVVHLDDSFAITETENAPGC